MATRRRWNISIWAGFAIVLAAVLSYIPIFVQFAVTRDFPWVNLLLFLVGGCLLAIGLKRAFREKELYRGKVTGSILGALSLLLFGVFCYGIFYIANEMPSPAGALHAGQRAPEFTLPSADGKQVVLSALLKNNRAVLLIFYRGYW
jgi:predicted membrane channel-forming protein YqfA (hemolysin III family)